MPGRDTPGSKIRRAIVSFLLAGLFIFMMIFTYRETALKAKLYTAPVTGTVQQCESSPKKGDGRTRKSKYYSITIAYEIEPGTERTLKRNDQTRYYAKGEQVELMYNPDTGEAVRRSETKQDIKIYLVVGVCTILAAANGVSLLLRARRW